MVQHQNWKDMRLQFRYMLFLCIIDDRLNQRNCKSLSLIDHSHHHKTKKAKTYKEKKTTSVPQKGLKLEASRNIAD